MVTLDDARTVPVRAEDTAAYPTRPVANRMAHRGLGTDPESPAPRNERKT